MLRYIIAGGSGLIGQALLTTLAQNHHQTQASILVLTRTPRAVSHLAAGFPTLNLQIVSYENLFTADGPRCTPDDIIINLAGENIGARRLTSARLRQLLDSRLNIINTLMRWCEHRAQSPRLFIQASAMAAFEDSDIEKSDEGLIVPPHKAPGVYLTSLHDLAVSLEATALAFPGPTLCVRLPLVLSPVAPLVQKLAALPRLKVLDGCNYLPLASATDCARALLFAAGQELSGILAINAPHYVNLRTLLLSLGKQHIPAIPTLSVGLKLGSKLDGRMGLFLENKKIKSARLLQAGFVFLHPQALSVLPH